MAHGWHYTSHLRNRDWVNPITGDELWCVTVPRDYDGAQRLGINKGDYMADYWEEQNCAAAPLPRYSDDILEFYPFYTRNDSGGFDGNVPADKDTFFTGLEIPGDRFVNWEEYRGFHVVGDPETGEYTTLIHKRFNPRLKTYLIDWRKKFIPKDVRLAIPLFDNGIDSTEIYYVNAFILNDDDTRFSNNRYVGLNRIGASFDYYSVPGITNNPLSKSILQNAVSFWTINPAEIEFILNNREVFGIDPNRHVGWCIQMRRQDIIGRFPEFHSRIVIVPDNLRKWKTTPGVYYWNNPLDWKDDLISMLSYVIHHEIGHTTGMLDEENSLYYMNEEVPIEYDTLDADYGKFLPAGTILDYSPNSRSQFSIVPPPPQMEQP